MMLGCVPVSYTHLRAHETVLDIVCRLLLEKKNEPGSSNQILEAKFMTQTTVAASTEK